MFLFLRMAKAISLAYDHLTIIRLGIIINYVEKKPQTF